MSNIGYNLLVLAFCWLMVTGAGVYFTFFQQPQEIERLKKEEKVLELEQQELQTLAAQEAGLHEQARQIDAKWRSRYKVVPENLSSPDVIGFMNELTDRGFENFDVVFEGEQRTSDYSYYGFSIRGRGYFESLYRFIWEMENSRYLYRVETLELDHIDLVTEDRRTKRPQLKVMVSFRIVLHAYFDGVDALSVPPAGLAMLEEEAARQAAAVPEEGDVPNVPAHVLPSMKPDTNPFRPAIMEKLPPNSENRVDLDRASLLSIVGSQAMVEYEGELRTLQVGDRVDLGKVVAVDPHLNRVMARLNRGGIYDEVELRLETGSEAYRQALGPNSLTPSGGGR